MSYNSQNQESTLKRIKQIKPTKYKINLQKKKKNSKYIHTYSRNQARKTAGNEKGERKITNQGNGPSSPVLRPTHLYLFAALTPTFVAVRPVRAVAPLLPLRPARPLASTFRPLPALLLRAVLTLLLPLLAGFLACTLLGLSTLPPGCLSIHLQNGLHKRGGRANGC